MESTDMYWKPVINILEPGALTIMAINARQGNKIMKGIMT